MEMSTQNILLQVSEELNVSNHYQFIESLLDKM
jgi:hypothetical protein